MSKVVRELERRIVATVIDDLTDAGFGLMYYCEDRDENINVLDSSEATLDGIFNYDEQRLFATHYTRRTGWVYFVYGGDGWDVISDYSTNLEPWMQRALSLSKQYA